MLSFPKETNERRKVFGNKHLCKSRKRMKGQIRIPLPPFTRGLHDITALVLESGIGMPANGLLHVFLPHTSAGLLIQENADPDVRGDLEAFMDRMVPEGPGHYNHVAEGPDDMPAHIKSMLTSVSLSIPVIGGKPALGTWQGIYLFEFRNSAPARQLIITAIPQ